METNRATRALYLYLWLKKLTIINDREKISDINEA